MNSLIQISYSLFLFGVVVMVAKSQGEPNYDLVTWEEHDAILEELIDGKSAKELLHIPGIYEVVSEEWNNDILDIWADRREEAVDGSGN